ncbi:MAG: restriction endonuclease subunit S [Roseburia sp.]|nr:restriction endonuclease subunit S [Roseburia sp.]
MAKVKNSGIEWIGDIPVDWDVKRILYVIEQPITDGPHTTPDMMDEGIPFVSAEAVSTGNGSINFDNIWGYISEEFYKECCKKYIPKKDDIYMIKSGATTGKVSIVDTDDIFTIWSPLAVIRCDRQSCLPKFMYYSLQADFFQMQVQLGWTYGTQQNIGMRTLEHLKICVPSTTEQQAIAEFLDKRCAEIDDVIADIKKQIELLQQYKKSLITETVTKGLDKTVPMKDSGVEWIGKMPEHWKLKHIKYVAEFINGDRSENYPSGNDMVDEGIIFVTSNNIHGLVLDTSLANSKYITEEKYKLLRGAKMQIDDIIFCLRGSVGMCAVNKSENEGTVASSLVVIRTKDIDADYLNYYLQSQYALFQTDLYTNGSCAANLSAENVASYYVLEPKPTEQRNIADFLEKKCTQIDFIIESKQKQLETIAEHKKSLIYEYVTGKKRVKEVQ